MASKVAVIRTTRHLPDLACRLHQSAYRANAKSLGGPHGCHCEELRDEAISILSMGDGFASLAMTYRMALSNDFAFALSRHTERLVCGW
jgi:hypothetical protein